MLVRNIYWDGAQLTFDPYGTATHEQYQGLFFRWGSLIGLQAGTTGTNWSTSNTIYNITSAVTPGNLGWNDTDLPYQTTPLTDVKGSYDLAPGNDVCTAIDANYRMPVGGEFGYAASQYVREPTTGGFTAMVGNIDGTSSISSGYRLS